jgi:antitoxin (DNA-binding transcriptional repressor) of toxin-antitoxin stability system
MEEVELSKFRTNLSAILKSIDKTGKPIRITRKGEALVELHPVPRKDPPRLTGGVGVIVGDTAGR